jgi:hypothetical protein
MWESDDGSLMVIEAIRETDLSFQLADRLLRVKSLFKHSQLPALQLTGEVEGLCGQLDQAIATLHRTKDRPAAKTRGTKGGLATNAESRALRDWAEALVASGKVPVKFKGATAIARWLLTLSPDEIQKTCPIHDTLEDPERVIRDEILRKRKAARLSE